MYTIEAVSPYEELFRYNILISCATYDSQGGELWVGGGEHIYGEIAEVGYLDRYRNVLELPEEYEVARPLIVTCDSEVDGRQVASLRAILYIIPHTMPESIVIRESPPFPITLSISRDGEQLFSQEYKVNQWGGDNIDVTVECQK